MNTQATISKSNTQEIVTALSSYDMPSIRRFQDKTKQANLQHLPGDSGMPFFGHSYWFLRNAHDWLNKQHEKYGPVFRLHTPVVDSVMLLGPEANKLVFQNEENNFSNLLAWEPNFRTLFDNNILQRDFADHKALRSLFKTAFTRQAMEGHMAIMNPLLKDGISKWPTGKPIKSMDYVKKLLLNTGANVFLGLEIGAEADRLNEAFVDMLNAFSDVIRRKEIWFSPYAKGLKGNKILSKFVFENIEARRKVEGRDVFSQLCRLEDDDGKMFSNADIRDHIIFVLFAAHDTTTSAATAVLYALASNPQWQEELREEMFSLNKDEMEFDDGNLLEKTTWTIKEALRMHPPLVVMPRYALEEFEFQGHRIPANTNVSVSSLFTHYMPEYWSNPTQFDPQRFSKERAEDKKDFFQYIPFGGGAHKCLGLHFAQTQGKMLLFHLLKQYRISKDPKMTRYKYNNVPLTFPTDGLPLTFTKI